MKKTLILAALTALAAAQTIADLPACSHECLINAIDGLGCGLIDFTCSCQKADQLAPAVTPCIQTSCTDPADQGKTIGVLSSICAAAGYSAEAPAPSASSAASVPSSEAPIKTPTSSRAAPELPITEDPVYSVFPTATQTASEYSAPVHATSDVPNLPSSELPSDFISLPSFVDTIIVSRPSPKPTSVPGVLPPYPTGTPASSAPAPSGTGSPSTTSLPVPEFTGAAVAVEVPFAIAGVLGVAAFVL